MAVTKKTPVVPALEKALDILEYIAQEGVPVTLKDITTTLNIPHATAYRTVKYLCSRNYLKPDPQSESAYYLGPQLLYLAHVMNRQFDLITEAAPIIKELAARTNQTAQIGVLQDLGVMYVDQAQPTRPVTIIAALRTVIPVNLSASGKVLVAHLLPREQEYFLQNCTLAKQTKNSIVDLDRFREELATVKAQGYAFDHEEYARGIGCLAAPIWDHTDQVIAAVGVTGHIADYTDDDNRAHLVDLVCAAAQEISQTIGAGVALERDIAR